MPRKRAASIDEKSLKKGQLRKLETLRKQLGPEIADKAFAEWLSSAVGQEVGADRPGTIPLAERRRRSVRRAADGVRPGEGLAQDQPL